MPPNAPVRRFTELAIPRNEFKGWVRCVLGTTQVTANVVLLALLFIYRLKKANPTVKGRAGSEYRLLTVALMLGNKCESLQNPAPRGRGGSFLRSSSLTG